MTSISDTTINVETQTFANTESNLQTWGISITRQKVSSNIQTQRSGLKKQGTAAFSSDQLRDVWTLNETLGKVLDILKTFKVIPQCLKFHNV